MTAAVAEDGDLGASAISYGEVTTLVRRGRLKLDRPAGLWVQQALSPSEIVRLDVAPKIAATTGALVDGFPRDPADRILVATVLTLDVRIATMDSKLRRPEGVRALL